MRRQASIRFDAFDPEVQEAAQEAARRAGMRVEDWLAATVGGTPAGKPSAEVPRRMGSVTRQTAAVDKPFDADRAPPRRTRRGAPTEGPKVETEALDHLARRLDEIDRRIADSRTASAQDAARSMEAFEARMKAALADGGADASASRLEEMLAGFEMRIAALGERIAAPRALGRRGRPADAEVRDAVAEIRQRQRELDGAPETAAVEAVEHEPVVVPEVASSPVIADLRTETKRLREAIGGLAQGGDVGALETSVRTLTAEVTRAQGTADLAAVAGPIDLLRVQVERLGADVAADVHARVATDVERLAARMDDALDALRGPAAHETRALEDLFTELDAVRRQIAALAEPQRIQALAADVARLGEAVVRLDDAAAQAPRMPALERRFDALADRLDGLGAAPAAQADVLSRIDALSVKLDGIGRGEADTSAALHARLERIDTHLRGPGPTRELTAIHGALEGIADRLDRIGEPGAVGQEAIEGLERHVLALAARLDGRDRDPAIAGLERTMRDLATEVAALREAAPTAATLERATRLAVTDALGGVPRHAGDAPEVAGLRHGLADLKASQDASEHRIQGTLEGVHAALARLVDRLAAVETDRGPEAALAPTSKAASKAASESRAAPASRAAAPMVPEAIPVRAARRGAPNLDELLEPGADRPLATPPAAPIPAEAEASDVKANFIAAARRAAQAAAAEASQSLSSTASPDASAVRRSAEEASAAKGKRAPRKATVGLNLTGRGAQLLRMRRSLVIGLAAAVLALGALKLGSGLVGSHTTDAPAPPRAAASVPAAPALPAPGVEATPPAAEPRPKAEAPATEAPAPAAPAPTPRPEAGLSRVPDMAALEPDLAAVPGGLSNLRQAALGGDAAAVYDLAARAVDGRGTPRDPKLAARLFEKVAGIGSAPAAYRLGNLSEKGIGVPKDLAAARQLYAQAAEKGNVRAMHNLAVVLAESGAETGKPDYAAAVTWFRRAAEYGIRDSQYNLGVLLARGLGTQQDLAQAYLWFAAAAAQGDEDAGKKRDEVGAKMAAKDLDGAKVQVAAWRPRTPDPAANDAPQSIATRAESVAAKAMGTSLVGAPPPGAPAKRADAAPQRKI